MRGVDGDGVERACERNDAGAGAQRRPRRKPRRAGLMRGAGKDERRAARIFVRTRVEPRQRGAPQGRRIDEGLAARCAASTLAGMPMSARRILPQSARPGSSRWPGLRRKKVTLDVASTATPRTLPLAPSTPEGDVDREHRARRRGRRH